MENGDIVDVFAEQRGDIGYWGTHAKTIGVQALHGHLAAPSEASVIMASLGADPFANVKHCPNPDLLSITARKALIARADSERKCDQSDIIVDLKLTELRDVAGVKAMNWLINQFGCRVDQVKIRRVAANGKDHVINFHRDFSVKTMQVMLNDETEYEGGRVIYATKDGLYQPRRGVGDVVIHDNTVAHGVSALTSGVRYSLFMLALPASS